MRRSLLLLSALALVATSCASTNQKSSAPGGAAAATKGDDAADKVRDLEHALSIAQAKLEIARLESESYDQEQEVKMRHARAELEMAKSDEARFVEAEMPNRLADEDLSLQAARDRAQEAADELAQIEIMYADQDLDDMTAEFVVRRGRRSAERAAARIKIQEAMFQALQERELPAERRKHEMAVDRAAASLAKAEREGEIGRRGKLISIKEAEKAVEKAERELDEAREKAKP